VGDEHDGLAVTLPDLEQFVLQALARQRVERAERLIHQQDLRPIGERAGERDALFHAPRQLLGIEAFERFQMHEFEQLARTRLRLALRQSLLQGTVHDVAEYGLPRKQGKFLEHRPAVRTRTRNRRAADSNAAAGRLDEAADDVE
jgi:hypothetical protein